MCDIERQVAAIIDFEKDHDAFTFTGRSGERRFRAKHWKSDPLVCRHDANIFKFKFIYLNDARYGALAVDVDEFYRDPDGYEPGLDPATFGDVPMPNYSICSGNGHFQAYWILKDPLPLGASEQSLNYMATVRNGLTDALDGDFAFNLRGAARNPFCVDLKGKRWHGDRYSLGDLDLGWRPSRRPYIALEYVKGQRNHATFRFGLAIFKQRPSISFEALVQEMETWQREQAPEKPLETAENELIAGSIFRNGHRYACRANRNYGRMKLPQAPWSEMSEGEIVKEIRKRQRQGALWVAEQKTMTTTDKILKAVVELEEAGEKATQVAIAEKTGLSLRTVKTYWNKRKS